MRKALVVAAFALMLAGGTNAQMVTATVTVGSTPGAVAVNPVTNKIYVANAGSNNVSVIDGATNNVSTVATVSSPTAVAVNPVTNLIYVASGNSANVTVINGASGSTTNVPVGGSSTALAVNPVTNKIYVAGATTSNVTVIDGLSNGTTTVLAGQFPSAVAVNPVTNKIYVANSGSGNVTVINGASNAATPVSVGSDPGSVAIDPATNKIYVANYASNNVTVIDGASDGTLTVPTGTSPSSVVVNPVTNQIYVACQGSGVTVIAGASNTPTSVTAGLSPYFVAVNPMTNQIYVANQAGGNVTAINGATSAVTTVSAGAGPVAVAVNPVTDRVYVVNKGDGSVTVIDGAKYSLTTIGLVVQYIDFVVVNPVTNKIYVGNDNSHIVEIDGGTNAVSAIDTGDNQLPTAAAVNPVTNKIYVANENSIAVVDGATSTTTVSIPATVNVLAVNPVTNKVYGIGGAGTSVVVVDGATNATTSVPTASTLGVMAVNPATNKIYVAIQNGVTILDGSNNTASTLMLGLSPNTLAVNPVTNKIYAGGAYGGVVIDGTTNAVASIPLDTSPYAIAVNPVTNKIYVTYGYAGNEVTVLDGTTNTVTRVMQSMSSPSALAVDPAANKIFVANSGGNNIVVIDGATNTVTALGSGIQGNVAVNPITGRAYVSGGAMVRVVSGPQLQPIPLTTSITPLTNNQTPGSNPTFTFSAGSTFSPIATTPDNVYFQVDGLQNAWTPVMGSNPAYVGMASLQPGFHILYAYAGDGQEATSTQAGSPLTGAVQAYGFVVTGSEILPFPQTVTFVNLPAQAVVGTSITLSATAMTSVTFSSPSSASICSVSGTTLTFNGIGVCTVTATAAQTANYQGVATSQSITVLLGQSISFNPITSQYVGFPLTLDATATSGLPVTFTSSTPGICSVSGDVADFLTGGTCTIVASQAGNSSYVAATPVTQSFTVIGGSSNDLGFIPVTPCRVVDTRGAAGSLGGPTMTASSTRSFPLPMGACGLPATAAAYSLNVTVVPQTKLNYLSLWPTGQAQPVVSTLNSFDGRIVANAAIVPAGTNGAVSAFVTNQTDVIMDVNGYFAPAGAPGTLTFVPVTPCRVEDTRNAAGTFGGPNLWPGLSRSFPVPSSACSIPATAAAYSVNATVVPAADLGYLTLYPTGAAQPYVSTLNSYNGQVVANAAIVPAGTGGAISAYVTDRTDLITDINGYFTSTPAMPSIFSTVTPCRVVDTRNATGTFGGPIMQAGSTRSFPIPSGACGIPATATAYAFNVTVVPTVGLGYLTLWPDGQAQPTVSTLNSYNGQVVANAALVPAGNAGAVDVFVTDQTQVIIDIVGYFSAP